MVGTAISYIYIIIYHRYLVKQKKIVNEQFEFD